MHTLWNEWDGPVLAMVVTLPTNQRGGSFAVQVRSLEGKQRAAITSSWKTERDLMNLGQVAKGTVEAWQYGAIVDVCPEATRLIRQWLPRIPAGLLPPLRSV